MESISINHQAFDSAVFLLDTPSGLLFLDDMLSLSFFALFLLSDFQLKGNFNPIFLHEDIRHLEAYLVITVIFLHSY